MSNSDLRNEKQLVLLEDHENQEHLRHLRAKAGRISGELQEFARMLEKDPEHKIFDGSKQENHSIAIGDTDPKYRRALSYDAALEIADQIRKALADQKRIDSRKAALGIATELK